jgi:hypothetical protein
MDLNLARWWGRRPISWPGFNGARWHLDMVDSDFLAVIDSTDVNTV